MSSAPGERDSVELLARIARLSAEKAYVDERINNVSDFISGK